MFADLPDTSNDKKGKQDQKRHNLVFAGVPGQFFDNLSWGARWAVQHIAHCKCMCRFLSQLSCVSSFATDFVVIFAYDCIVFPAVVALGVPHLGVSSGNGWPAPFVNGWPTDWWMPQKTIK